MYECEWLRKIVGWKSEKIWDENSRAEDSVDQKCKMNYQ